MIIPKLLILLLNFTLLSCSMLDRRDFSGQMDSYNTDEPMFSANSDFMVISGDSGRAHRTSSEVKTRTPATYRDKHEATYQNSLRNEQKFLENRLSEDEYYEFDRNRKKIGSVSEQIYFLKLNERERHSFLSNRNISRQSSRKSRSYSSSGPRRVAFYETPAVKVKDDILLGMTMGSVMENWGSPEKRDIAGNPKYKNERWAFRRSGKIKYVYFESGKVQGWSEQ